MFVAVATRTMASAKFKAVIPDGFVRRTVDEVRAERRANNRDYLIRRERELAARIRLAEQRDIANEAIGRANKLLREMHGSDACVETIVRRICRVTKVRPEQIVSASQTYRVAFARQAICYWIRRLSGLSYSRIGQELGNRDHTTVLHGKRAYVEKRAKMGRTLRMVL